jgi:hypothetical protein
MNLTPERNGRDSPGRRLVGRPWRFLPSRAMFGVRAEAFPKADSQSLHRIQDLVSGATPRRRRRLQTPESMEESMCAVGSLLPRDGCGARAAGRVASSFRTESRMARISCADGTPSRRRPEPAGAPDGRCQSPAIEREAPGSQPIPEMLLLTTVVNRLIPPR